MGVGGEAAGCLCDRARGGSALRLRAFALRCRVLPDYMVPSAFVVLDALPLNRNGKVDRRALPAPDMAAARSNAMSAPRSETEAVFAQHLERGSGRRRVGVEDNFFELGGHSLLAVRALARVSGSLAAIRRCARCSRRRRFVSSRRRLKRLRRRKEAAAAPPLVSYCRSGMSPLSYAQQRLWFLDQLTPLDASYNVPAALRLVGEIDIGSFERR